VINTIKSRAANIKKANWAQMPKHTDALLICVNAQLDEPWSFVGSKKKSAVVMGSFVRIYWIDISRGCCIYLWQKNE